MTNTDVDEEEIDEEEVDEGEEDEEASDDAEAASDDAEAAADVTCPECEAEIDEEIERGRAHNSAWAEVAGLEFVAADLNN